MLTIVRYIRASEWVVLAFFTWTSFLAVILPLDSEVRVRTLIANSLVFAMYLALSRVQHFGWTRFARDWIPQGLIILAYKEMGWFAPRTHTYKFEHSWVVWDRMILNDWHARAAIESLGVVLPSLLELSYVLVYALPPVTMGIVYGLKLARRQTDTMLTIYLLGMLLCYAQFPFWPSEPPRTVFPGQDIPNIADTPVRSFSLWIVGNYGIHMSVFPSAHVSGAVAAALGIAYLIPQRRLLVTAYFVYAALVAVATVYGRYHYAVDALAGAAVGCISLPLGIWWSSRSTID